MNCRPWTCHVRLRMMLTRGKPHSWEQVSTQRRALWTLVELRERWVSSYITIVSWFWEMLEFKPNQNTSIKEIFDVLIIIIFISLMEVSNVMEHWEYFCCLLSLFHISQLMFVTFLFSIIFLFLLAGRTGKLILKIHRSYTLRVLFYGLYMVIVEW